MPKLQGKPGRYTVPGMGFVMTGSGLVDAPQESVAALLELGFTLLEPDTKSSAPEPAPAVEPAPAPKPKKSAGVMTTGDFGPIAPTK